MFVTKPVFADVANWINEHEDLIKEVELFFRTERDSLILSVKSEVSMREGLALEKSLSALVKDVNKFVKTHFRENHLGDQFLLHSFDDQHPAGIVMKEIFEKNFSRTEFQFLIPDWDKYRTDFRPNRFYMDPHLVDNFLHDRNIALNFKDVMNTTFSILKMALEKKSQQLKRELLKISSFVMFFLNWTKS